MLKKLNNIKLDNIVEISNKCKQDMNPNKINLLVGELTNYKFDCIKNIKSLENISYKYLPPAGCPEFIKNSRKLIFNSDNDFLGYQTLSGTGALWLSNEILKLLNINNIYIPELSWPNHYKIFENYKTYNYFNGYNIFPNSYYFINLEPSVFLFHSCCHNPSGIDYTKEQWDIICDYIDVGNHMVIFDNAYQGLASGNPEEDNYAIKLFADRNIPMMVCTSHSKNLGLYNQRLGSLFTNLKVENLDDHILQIIRKTYSNPPAYGTYIMNNVDYDEWKTDCLKIVEILNNKKNKLDELLYHNWPGLINTKGLFYMVPLSKSQIELLRDKYSIYLLDNGRMNIAGLEDDKMEYFANIINTEFYKD